MSQSPGTTAWVGRLLLLLVPVLAAVSLWWKGPIPQPIEYHQFADQRTILGVPNFWDVASNLPFVIVGFLGLRTLLRGGAPGCLPELRPAYFCFFVGTALIGLGSAYYHLTPNNETLIWDRLPMTVVFMAFVAIVIGEHFRPGIGARLLPVLLLLGVLSVAYWALTERSGHGDLRPYIFVQFVPMVLVPVILLLYPSVFNGVGYFWAVLASYALAKVLEHGDAPIFHCGEVLGGHALKHLASALATFFVWLALVRRHRR